MRLPIFKFVKKSLKAKFLILLLSILFFLATLISIVFITYQLNSQRRSILISARSFTSLSVKPLSNAYEIYFDSGDIKLKEITDKTLELEKSVTNFQIIDVNGVLLYDSKFPELSGEKISNQKILTAVNSDTHSEFKNKSGEVTEIIEPFFDDFGAHPYSFRFFVTYDSIREGLVYTISLAVGTSFFVAILSALIVILTVNRIIISPIEKIVAGAGLVSEGRLNERIFVPTGDELETLAQSVNNMASSLQKNIEALKDLDRLKDEFIIIASHNLRTPITVLKGYTSELIADPKSTKAYKDQYKAISVSISQLDSLVEEFLSIVSLESDKKITFDSKIDLGSVINEVISFFSPQALKKKVSLHFVSPKEAYPIRGDLTKLKIVFNNIVENAIKFNKSGGSITINISESKDDFVVSVKDTGIGISEKEIPLVFKKFHRATDILTYNYEGLGLGLYLARIIAEAHGGKIWFQSKTNLGSTFFISLPKEGNTIDRDAKE